MGEYFLMLRVTLGRKDITLQTNWLRTF